MQDLTKKIIIFRAVFTSPTVDNMLDESLKRIHPANRYSALEEWKSRIILLTLRYENKDTAYKPINSTLH